MLELAVGEGEEEGEGDGEGEPGTEDVFGEEGDGGDGDAGQEDEPDVAADCEAVAVAGYGPGGEGEDDELGEVCGAEAGEAPPAPAYVAERDEAHGRECLGHDVDLAVAFGQDDVGVAPRDGFEEHCHDGERQEGEDGEEGLGV